jgi:hypothetical protein
MRALGVLFLIGCGTDPAAICKQAVDHVNACAGRSVAAAPATCDADAAEQMLQLDCDALTRAVAHSDDKADSIGDGFRALACAIGLIRYCRVPACPARPAEAVCADYIADASCGGCQFYACREAESPCGPDGYYLGFAVKYCERFLGTLAPRMSPAGQRFLADARDCLMRYVDENIAPTDACSDVKRRALDSHVACYHDNGFCALPLSDKLLLYSAVDLADVDWITALRTLC